MNPIYIIVITCLLVFDFFPSILPNIILPKIILGLLIGFYLSLLLKKERHADHRAKFKEQMLSTLYLLFLIGLLTALGGKSSVGISFDNAFLWLVLLLPCFQIYLNWRKVKASKKEFP
ncbi:hypothetical protein [Bacillus sp. mrc49]|uniref:hypothetical protein n=1 Tax=Bacillus sp. mrc49 TaxID=2054913 RepID=UPI000C27E771|nr:hypothetical protein [Bacillus sp. mrc49]PJN89340.1 hypothetical protein CVN76_15770 [Bacillus sp. mrc49]